MIINILLLYFSRVSGLYFGENKYKLVYLAKYRLHM